MLRPPAALHRALFERNAAHAEERLKDTRDRLFALGQEAVREIRAYARFAFRNDTSPQRLALFGSDYLRERNRKQKRRLKALKAAAPAPSDG